MLIKPWILAIFITVSLISPRIFSQNSEEEKVKSVISNLFAGMEKGDSACYTVLFRKR